VVINTDTNTHLHQQNMVLPLYRADFIGYEKDLDPSFVDYVCG